MSALPSATHHSEATGRSERASGAGAPLSEERAEEVRKIDAKLGKLRAENLSGCFDHEIAQLENFRSAAIHGRTWIGAGDPRFPFGDRYMTMYDEATRGAIYERIYTRNIERVPALSAGETPEAILLMGRGGSGKSSFLRSHLGERARKFVYISADDVKEQIPEYQKAIDIGRDAEGKVITFDNAGLMCHWESIFVCEQIRERAMAAHKNLVLDATGSRNDDYNAFIDSLKARGYKVTLVLVDVDPDTAVERTRSRQEMTGRNVPEGVVRSADTPFVPYFKQLSAKVDRAIFCDNRDQMRVVWEKDAGEVVTVKPDFFQEHYPSFL